MVGNCLNSPKGAVIGPLVICGLVVDKKTENKLRRFGVKDSKKLSPRRREKLAEKIEEVATHTIVIRIPACKIDENRKNGVNLNQLEALKMAEIINMVNPDVAILDAPSHNSSKFRDYLWSKLDNKNLKLVCENYADINYPVVSAASIVAKIDRDAQIKKLEKKFGEPIGVGYPHDSVTIQFLEKLARENNGKMPRHIRTTWNTVQRITEKYKQKNVLSFFRKVFKNK